MGITAVKAPASLLLDPGLTASAKLIWMLSRLQIHPGEMTSAELQAQSGLSRPTVLRAVADLAATGRMEPETRPSAETRATLPGDLLTDRRLGPNARILYGACQLTPSFAKKTGQFTYASLSSLTGTNLKTIKFAVTALERTGWLHLTQQSRLSPISFTLLNPKLANRNAVVKARRRLNRAPYRGEALMKEYLSLLIDSNDWHNNARPNFLANPLTAEPLELDRYYTHKAAFEFNGAQHYVQTEHVTEQDVQDQQVRDLIKSALCAHNRILLVVIHPEDLSLKTMRNKIGQLLPLRDLGQEHEPLIYYLESTSRGYRSGTWGAGRPSPKLNPAPT